MFNNEDYPLGFPIYDRLALEAYPTICKMLDIAQQTDIANNICTYVKALDEVRKVLFDNNNLFLGKYQQFDILDAYLWRMGKFSSGNLSLLLGRKDYIEFIKNLKLNAKPVVGETDVFKEKDADYKRRMIDENGFGQIKKNEQTFDFNETIVRLYTEPLCQPFENVSDQTTKLYLEQLLEHWRKFKMLQNQ